MHNELGVSASHKKSPLIKNGEYRAYADDDLALYHSKFVKENGTIRCLGTLGNQMHKNGRCSLTLLWTKTIKIQKGQ